MKAYSIILSLLLLVGCETAKTTQQKPTEMQEKSAVIGTTQLYGFQFSLPDTFSKVVDDVATEDLKGNVRSRETSFKDSITGTELHIIWHPQPYGKALFDYYHSMLDENKASLTSIAGLPAVHYMEKLMTDGKGNPLPEMLIRDKYFILDKDEACLELLVNRNPTDKVADETFRKLIKEIKKL